MSRRRDKKILAINGMESGSTAQEADARPQRVASPCVSVCALDSQDVCIACHRSAEEISSWVVMNDDERREVLENAGARSRRNNPFV